MLQCRIKAKGQDVKEVMEYIAAMFDAGITAGVMRDPDGKKICEWWVE